MQRRTLAKLNIAVALLHQAVTAVAGFILPRYILLNYGSEANGLMQSISQLLGYMMLMEFGIGGMVRASWYKPLADGDKEAISDIFNNTKRFFDRISYVYIVFVLLLSFCAKFVISSEFDFWYVFSMVVVLAVNTYFNYYFGMAHQLLLKADQRLYVVQTVQIFTTVINTVLCIVAITLGASLHLVKFITAFVFLLNPIVYRMYVKRHYSISKTVCDKERKLPQKSDAVIHHLSYFIHRNTDIVILSIFKGVISVSVYSIYNSLLLVVEKLLSTVSTALSGAVGNIIAKDEKAALKRSLDIYDIVNTFVTTVAFSTMAAVILPFVKIYTSGVDDASYIRPLFAYLLLGAGFMYCIRIPFSTVVSSAGHYKETRTGAIVEVVLNLALSLALVKPFGLCGVAAGTLVSMAYRTFYTVWYLSGNIAHRPFFKFAKSLIANTAVGVSAVWFVTRFITVSTDSLWMFAIDACKAFVAIAVLFALLNVLIHKEVRGIIKGFLKKRV